MRKLLKSLQQKLEATMTAVAFAEEGEVETARQLAAEVPTSDAPEDAAAPARPGLVQPITLRRPERA
jgi:hypothetical protein